MQLLSLELAGELAARSPVFVLQVVYALNTRNEDHDSLIAALRQTYEERARQAEIRAAARLREMGERVKGACEEGERTVGEIRERFEEERERLKQAQVRLVHV